MIKKLSLGADAIGWNSLKKKKFYLVLKIWVRKSYNGCHFHMSLFNVIVKGKSVEAKMFKKLKVLVLELRLK